MKYKKAIPLTIAVVMLMFSGLAYAQDNQMLLQHDIFKNRQRPGVSFNHNSHSEKSDCLKCHHEYNERGDNLWDDSKESSCTTCHKLEAQGKIIPATKAFHLNCIGCHKSEGGPLACGKCHINRRLLL
ncbi:MAG: cytochrome c3 family protein [Pseudomonadota bacterium]